MKSLQESGWKEVKSGKQQKEPQISLSTGKAKYVRFSPSFFKKYDLEDENYVKLFFKKEDNNLLVGFKFLENREGGALKVSRNKKTGTGYVSSASLFNEIVNFELHKFNRTFKPIVEKYDEGDIFIIKIRLVI